MPNYRRAFVPGGRWFFTVNLLERRQTLLVDHIAALRKERRITPSACARGATADVIGSIRPYKSLPK